MNTEIPAYKDTRIEAGPLAKEFEAKYVGSELYEQYFNGLLSRYIPKGGEFAFETGRCNMCGEGTEQSFAHAWAYLVIAHKQGHPEAAGLLSFLPCQDRDKVTRIIRNMLARRDIVLELDPWMEQAERRDVRFKSALQFRLDSQTSSPVEEALISDTDKSSTGSSPRVGLS
jgi:hypothetical protein